ncbi:MAG: outer membrane lipoprotein chaperone LolA [Candidatus Thiodiazotropha sp.]
MYKPVSHFIQAALLWLMALSSAMAATGSQQLDAFLQGLQTLKADFRQTLEQPDNEQYFASNGVFYLKRPGLLRWEYEAPAKQLIVADGKRIWLYDMELEQVSHQAQDSALKGTPAQLLSATRPVSDFFEVNDLGEQDGLAWVELKPRDPEGQFRRLLLALEDNNLLRMEMYDNFGQITRFFFDGIQRNPDLDESLFHFEPPPLVDLIGD